MSNEVFAAAETTRATNQETLAIQNSIGRADRTVKQNRQARRNIGTQRGQLKLWNASGHMQEQEERVEEALPPAVPIEPGN